MGGTCLFPARKLFTVLLLATLPSYFEAQFFDFILDNIGQHYLCNSVVQNVTLLFKKNSIKPKGGL